jgi:hypothetical protein
MAVGRRTALSLTRSRILWLCNPYFSWLCITDMWVQTWSVPLVSDPKLGYAKLEDPVPYPLRSVPSCSSHLFFWQALILT